MTGIMCECPHCHADLRDDPIPTEHLGWYGGNPICDGCGDPRHGSRLIGIYDQGLDRTVSWLCPDCGVRWTR